METISSREELKALAQRMGELLAVEVEGDFYDVAEAFGVGYRTGTAAASTDSPEKAEMSALNALAAAAAEVTRWKVDDARENGMSWANIGGALDMSKQSAQQKYGRK